MKRLVLAGLLSGWAAAAPGAAGAQEAEPPSAAADSFVADSFASGPTTLATGGFELEYRLLLPGSREEVYDALTGDISGWWDHHLAEEPERLVLEPRPGGHFLEVFDASGDGAIHATVIMARRPELIRFEGPLGLTGHPLSLVTTYALEAAAGDSTRLEVTVRGAGQLEEGWASAVDGAWRHFLFQRLAPYVREGRHLAGASEEP